MAIYLIIPSTSSCVTLDLTSTPVMTGSPDLNPTLSPALCRIPIVESIDARRPRGFPPLALNEVFGMARIAVDPHARARRQPQNAAPTDLLEKRRAAAALRVRCSIRNLNTCIPKKKLLKQRKSSHSTTYWCWSQFPAAARTRRLNARTVTRSHASPGMPRLVLRQGPSETVLPGAKMAAELESTSIREFTTGWSRVPRAGNSQLLIARMLNMQEMQSTQRTKPSEFLPTISMPIYVFCGLSVQCKSEYEGWKKAGFETAQSDGCILFARLL
ncbi:hypothetical protein C8R44DRAFT_739338 [Mycena epipterygia]|nr:hypothetical protein C8R44DRAFT_739338 [Mycena epipterygia]